MSGKTVGSDYVTYSIWDGSGESATSVTEKDKNSKAAKGEVIKFTDAGEGIIQDVALVDGMTGAITAVDGKNVKISGNAYVLADDAVILNVDTDKVAGVPGNEISVAQQTETSKVYYENAYFVLNDDGEIELLVVDVVNGKWGSDPGTYSDT